VIRLRRVEAGDLEVIESQKINPEIAGEHSWFGFQDSGRAARRFAAGEIITADRGSLVVTDDEGAVIGEISWVKVCNGPPPNADCWNLGIWIDPEHRGKGYGTEAQRLGAAYLFANTMMERVQASTEITNVAEQRALEKAGFTLEGVLRRACFRDGDWRDMVMFSKLRGEK
jgi:RimJ/RimL family protein N-acetyltransferase